MVNPPMRLYSRWQNSAGERVRIALYLKKIDFEYVPISSLPRGEYLNFNPQGLLPTLEVDGQFVGQSSAILEYLEEAYPGNTLLPEDPLLRAQSRAFAAHIASEIHSLTVKRVRKQIAADAVQDWVEHWHKRGFQALETTLRQRDTQSCYCYGDKPGWADLHLIPQLANARRFNVDISDYPLLLEIEANCVVLDAFQKARPENQPDFPKC